MKTIVCIPVLFALIFTATSPTLGQWVQTFGLHGSYINALAPDLSGNLFAGGSGDGVFLSTNNGAS